jgi:hypothetical protein
MDPACPRVQVCSHTPGAKLASNALPSLVLQSSHRKSASSTWLTVSGVDYREQVFKVPIEIALQLQSFFGQLRDRTG